MTIQLTAVPVAGIDRSEYQFEVGRVRPNTGGSMAKGYWVSVYPAISDPERLTAYFKLAGPAVQAGGGRTLSRGGRVVAHAAGITQPVVLTGVDSCEQAVAA